MTSEDTHNATSLRESAYGQLPCEMLDGQTIDLFGQEAAPASRSARQERKPPNQMSATYGRIGQGSSESVTLQQSLASKLHQLLPTAGSMMWPLIWKRKVTPSLRQYCQLALLGRSTGATGYGLWQTPVADDAVNRLKGKFNSRGEPKLSAQATWPTATATMREDDPVQRAERGKSNLGEIVNSMWATPSARDWKDTQGMSKVAGGGESEPTSYRDKSLWLTPSANEDAAGTVKGKMQKMLTHQAKESSGLNAPTESCGQLSPEFVFWLMGFPAGYLSCVQRGMLSIQDRRKSSSKQQGSA